MCCWGREVLGLRSRAVLGVAKGMATQTRRERWEHKVSGKDESMQEGREEREKTTVRMCRRFPSTGHTDGAFALLSKQKKNNFNLLD